jgi:hypothetical protein
MFTLYCINERTGAVKSALRIRNVHNVDKLKAWLPNTVQVAA